jgi:hypothetical protein
VLLRQKHRLWQLGSSAGLPEVDMAHAPDALLRSLKTGDLVLFAPPALARWLPGPFGRRGWSHIALVVRDPDHAEPMIWETAPPATSGPRVRLRRLAKRLESHRGRISVRRLSQALAPTQSDKLAVWRGTLEARQSQRSLLDLMGAGDDGWLGGQKDALGALLPGELVAEGYQTVGLLDRPERGGRAADEYAPRDFAERENLRLSRSYVLGPEIPLTLSEAATPLEKLTAQHA